MTTALSSSNLVSQFVESFQNADLALMRKILAPNFISYVTNSSGTADKLLGAENFIKRVEAMKIPSVNFKLTITQTLEIEPNLFMLMVEVNAHKGPNHLHNFASILLRLENNKISTYWMVEALPKKSEEFWLD